MMRSASPERAPHDLIRPPQSAAALDPLSRMDIRERAELYDMAFSACPAGFIVWGSDARIMDWNPAAERIFAWTRAEAMAQPSPHFLVPEAVWPHVQALFVQLLAAEEPTDSRNDNVTKDGRVIQCEWHNIPMRDAENRVAGFVSIVEDVTERMRAEEALQAEIAERRRVEVEMQRVLTESEQILASITSILVSVDESGDVTTWNAAAAAAFGRPTSDVLGTPFATCVAGEHWDSIGRASTQCLNERRPVRLDDVRYVTPDGRERYLGITINPINLFWDEPKGFLLLAADITERRALQGQLAHAQKLESIGQLAAGIAHEINTPIQYVGDNTRFLQTAMADLHPLLAAYGALARSAAGAAPREAAAVAQAEEEADLEYLLGEIPRAIAQSLEGIDRVTGIVRAMKDFSHPGTASQVPTDLNQSLGSTITVASNEWKYVAELVTDFDPALPPVPCFPADLNQVFLNMIVNAAHAIGDVVGDATSGKGTITVGTRHGRDYVEVWIADTGKGMTEEVKARVFDPFFTTKPPGRGTGQGLAISHTVVVEKHGGTISVETALGVGTTFTIRLPLPSLAGGGDGPEHTLDH